MDKEIFVSNVATIANVFALTKLITQKLGYEHIAPFDDAIHNEKISKAINSRLKSIQED